MSPTLTQRVATAVATATLVELLDAPTLPAGKGAAILTIDAAARHAELYDPRRLDRRVDAYAASFATTYLRYFRPRDTRPVLLDAELTLADVPARFTGAHERLLGAIPGAPAVPLLAWPTSAGLLIDELTVTHTADAVLTDTHTAARVAAWFAIGEHLGTLRRLGLGGFAGVRVLPPRAPAAAVHHVHVDGEHTAHRLGNCPTCLPRSAR
jgi:hypothetical protein